MILSFRKPKNQIHIYEKYIIPYLRKNPGIKWIPYIPIENKPIQYLEIGVHKGENIIDIANSYCKHPDSRMYCVDPWIDYDEYPEYKGKQDILFDIFKKNTSSCIDKCILNRGFSDDIVPTFQNNFFDIVFVDGNHETEFVYRDGMMALEKVKPGGYIIFDDYYKGCWDTVVLGVDRFLEEMKYKIQIIANPTNCCELYGHSPQVIVRKL